MNEFERAEFERQKHKAEEQLNQMYFGANKKPSKNGSLTMPPFLAPPKPKQYNTSAQNANTVNQEKQKPKKSAERQTDQPKKNSLQRTSILNFLNFKGMKMDNDRLIILAICLLLAGEETDELLMLALIYIML